MTIELGLQMLTSDLQEEDLKLIEEEERILEAILAALRKEQEKQFSDVGVNREAFLQLLRDSQGSSDNDLPALLQELQIKSSLENRSRPAPLPDASMPYFARLVLQEDDRSRTILLGYSTFLSNSCRYPIVDWRNAPAAKLFYRFRQGDQFEQVLPERIAEGVIAQRNVVTIHNGVLRRIQSPDSLLIKNDDGRWQRQSTDAYRFSGGEQKAIRGVTFGVGASGAKTPDVSALLDQDQFDLLNEDPELPLLILGGAGSGKTTVVLHRIASLHYRDRARFNDRSMIVIVPDEGLVRLSRNLLSVIGMPKVEVSTFDSWIHAQGRRIIKKLPGKLCAETPSRVILLKRHPGMLKVVRRYLHEYALQVIERLGTAFPVAMTRLDLEPPASTDEMPLSHWLDYVQEQVSGALDPSNGKERSRKSLGDYFRSERQKLHDIAADRKAMFSDHLVLGAGFEDYPDITAKHIDEIVSHQRQQSRRTTKELYEDVDEERKVGIDGRIITEESDDIAGTIDVEDYPILFELLRQKTGKVETPSGGRLHQYAHMVLDEAQELARVDLSILSHALQEPKCVSIAGDSAQQTDVSTSFESWEHVLDLLGLDGHKSSHLTTNYRSPEPISEFAHGVLGDLAGPRPTTTRQGAPVIRARYNSYAEGVMAVFDILSGLMDAEPHASVAVIARDEASAARVFDSLSEIPDARLVESGKFSFKPGIDVTHVADVKGLEFDYVVIPDADAHIYRDDNHARRALHVAATRAVHQLLVVTTGQPSPILPEEEESSDS